VNGLNGRRRQLKRQGGHDRRCRPPKKDLYRIAGDEWIISAVPHEVHSNVVRMRMNEIARAREVTKVLLGRDPRFIER
jgi:hypothetical protein